MTLCDRRPPAPSKVTGGSRVHFLDLPDDILEHIIQFLAISDLAVLGCVDRAMYELCGRCPVWRRTAVKIMRDERLVDWPFLRELLDVESQISDRDICREYLYELRHNVKRFVNSSKDEFEVPACSEDEVGTPSSPVSSSSSSCSSSSPSSCSASSAASVDMGRSPSKRKYGGEARKGGAAAVTGAEKVILLCGPPSIQKLALLQSAGLPTTPSQSPDVAFDFDATEIPELITAKCGPITLCVCDISRVLLKDSLRGTSMRKLAAAVDGVVFVTENSDEAMDDALFCLHSRILPSCGSRVPVAVMVESATGAPLTDECVVQAYVGLRLYPASRAVCECVWCTCYSTEKRRNIYAHAVSSAGGEGVTQTLGWLLANAKRKPGRKLKI